MPTRAGWAVGAVGVAVIVVGRLFGVFELFILGTALVVAVVAAVASVRLRPVRLRIVRRVTPSRVHAGETARVELVVANRTSWPIPTVVLRDPVSTTRGARLQLTPLAPGGSARAAYRLPTEQRGRLTIGPLSIERTDPLGLAARTAVAAEATTVTVLPRWYPVPVPGRGADTGPLGQHLRLRALGRSGDEFRSLREYVPGDDLRRISWRASARSEELKVRENETTGTRDLTVLLDLEASRHRPESFERAVSVATSVMMSAAEYGRSVRFMTTAGFEHTTGAVGIDLLLEHLAVVQPVEGAPIELALGQLNTLSNGGLLVVAGGRIDPPLAAAVRRSPAADAVVFVACDLPLPAAGPGSFVVDATVDDTFPAGWNLLVGASDGAGGVEHRSARPVGAIVLGDGLA